MEKSELLKSYEQELKGYATGIDLDFFFSVSVSDTWCLYRHDIDKINYKDDRLRKLDTLLFIEVTKRPPDGCDYYDSKTWYFCLYDIHTKEFPIELLPDYLQPLYQKYLDNKLVIPDDIPEDILPLYNNLYNEKSIFPLLNL
ncbi:MAG: hypothetical protein KatS3mg068_1254 [Candidatus Sericytochromatia bacterium]|nr:MAG: hypothetical protein KatS3mg068_1254 [Candidatus Sericytochromatia bacterium]